MLTKSDNDSPLKEERGSLRAGRPFSTVTGHGRPRVSPTGHQQRGRVLGEWLCELVLSDVTWASGKPGWHCCLLKGTGNVLVTFERFSCIWLFLKELNLAL